MQILGPETRNDTEFPLSRLNFVRFLIVLAIGFGYASTMPLGPEYQETWSHLGYDPSWIGIQILFFFSGFLALRSLRRHGSSFEYLRSRFARNMPLLVIFTLMTVLLIYPLLGVPADSLGDLVKKLTAYFFETVTCLNPGQPLPGLLDNARYMCLIQGAIWTFRWGLIAHIGTAIGNKIGLFKSNRLILGLTILATLAYFAMSRMMAWNTLNVPNTVFTAIHLSFPFLWGMSAYAYRDKFPKTSRGQITLLLGLSGTAAFWYMFLKWSPAIELLLTGFWTYVCWLLLTTQTGFDRITKSMPDITLSFYLIMWPAAQLLLLALPDLGSWELIALSLPLTTLLAFLTASLLNRRLVKWVGKFSFRKVAVQPT